METPFGDLHDSDLSARSRCTAAGGVVILLPSPAGGAFLRQENSPHRSGDISTRGHTDARVATLIIVSGCERDGLAHKCNVLPFYISNSGSHEPLQASGSGPSCAVVTADGRTERATERAVAAAATAAAAATPGNVGRPSVLTSASSDGIHVLSVKCPGEWHGSVSFEHLDEMSVACKQCELH
ncbi:hypothetical protein Q5P01_009668 [Channa striata]|uniref:Uncharacterized protein n=1 Tax=Channa striata TaxID=64152 RepID=A0AA88SR13_CHASR|nr:hypothetical protein Q5P01_009668 [Channa striata]